MKNGIISKNESDKIMLGLAILFGLFVWIVVTLIAMVIGYKIGKKAHYPKMGALAGFMLTMGGWIVYWAIEFAYIQAQVTKLCEKEAGITIYVTPEQWREQIGEEEWEKIQELDIMGQRSYPRKTITINKTNYISTMMMNSHLIKFSTVKNINDFIVEHRSVILDYKDDNILLGYTYFSAGSGSWLASGSPKFWLNNIQSCEDDIHQQLSNLVKLYSNSF